MGSDPVNGSELKDQRTGPRKKPFTGSDPMDGSDLAPRSSGKENQSNVKPFIGTLRVTNPARQSWTSSRKRVLRGGG
jgi:hypothetical protein